jgi:predicted DNA-binding ribbon-helix-helix protein
MDVDHPVPQAPTTRVAPGFRGEPEGCDGRVQGELGAGAIMTKKKQHTAQTMPSPVRKRSVVVSRHKTSVSLEEPFWQALREIAAEREMTTSALLSSIASKRGESNLSSAVRLAVLEHFRAARQKETKA